MTEPKSLDQALSEAFSKADHLQAPLDQRLKLYLGESRKLLPEMEETYDQLVARITANIEDSNQIPGGWRGSARFLHDRQRGTAC